MKYREMNLGWATLMVEDTNKRPYLCPCGSGQRSKKCDHPIPDHLMPTDQELEEYEKREPPKLSQ